MLKYFLNLSLILLLGLSSYSTSVLAEYRAFHLKITSADGKNTSFIKSSLDPIQYRYYYTVKETEIVTYVDTWRCPGRTGGLQPICNNPKDLPIIPPKSPERAPASN